jgi:hypothetical protein
MKNDKFYNPELPWLEDILYPYFKLMVHNTFPKKDFLTIFLGIIHIIAFLVIHIGIWLPPKFLIFYIFYLLVIFITYKIFNENCFLTILSKISSNSNRMPIIIRMSNASRIIFFYLVLAIFILLYPKIAPFNLLKNLIIFLDNL